MLFPGASEGPRFLDALEFEQVISSIILDLLPTWQMGREDGRGSFGQVRLSYLQEGWRANRKETQAQVSTTVVRMP